MSDSIEEKQVRLVLGPFELVRSPKSLGPSGQEYWVLPGGVHATMNQIDAIGRINGWWPTVTIKTVRYKDE